MRVRNIYTAKDRLGPQAIRYEELADPKYKGKICTRSGKHPYNIALVASMIAHHGEADTKTWLQGVKTNLARKPQGNDRGQVQAVKEGLCDIAIGNSYYYGNMLQDPEQKSWAEAVVINFPNQADRGAHVNVSGMVLTRHAPNKDNAIKLMEFLSGDVAQKAYAEVNMEYPVKADVAPSTLVASWGEFKADQLPIFKLAEYHQAAVKLLDELLVLPLFALLLQAAQPDEAVFGHLLSTVLPTYIANSLWLILWVSIGSLLLALPCAWLMARCEFIGRRYLQWALLLPLAMPAYIVAYVYTDLLDYAGPVQRSLRAGPSTKEFARGLWLELTAGLLFPRYSHFRWRRLCAIDGVISLYLSVSAHRVYGAIPKLGPCIKDHGMLALAEFLALIFADGKARLGRGCRFSGDGNRSGFRHS